MEANHEIIEAVPICTKCGKKLSKVNTSFFDRNGDDYERSVEFSCCKNESGEYAIGLNIDTSWCGYELSDEEKMEGIRCPHCGKYPFDFKLGVSELENFLVVTCWTKNAEEIPPSQAGNMAKMREALTSAYDVLDKLLYSSADREKNSLICKTKRIIEEALAAPARNCDALPPEKLLLAFNNFHQRYFRADGLCGIGCPLRKCSYSKIDCALRWVQLAYEEPKHDYTK